MTAAVAVFRCDAGRALGAGHVMRCLALEAALREQGWKTAFATVAETLEVLPALGSTDHLIVTDDPDVGQRAIAGRFGAGVDWLIVDHRTLNKDFESRSRAWARHVLVIEDFPDRTHDCDLLLDQTAGREPREYAGRVPAQCRVVTGAAFALLRPEFAKARLSLERDRDRPQDRRRLLLSFGATDPYGLTAPLLRELLRQDQDIRIDVVCGAGPERSIAATAAEHPHRVSLHVGVRDMVPLMIRADLGVGVGGMTAWERCALGLPSAMFIPNEYHRLFAERLAGTGAAAIVGDYRDLSIEQAGRGILTLLCDRAWMKAASDAAFALCDGEGARRVAREMSSIMTTQPPRGMSQA